MKADAVYSHQDVSKEASPLAELEPLYNVSVDVDAAELVGLGRLSPLEQEATTPRLQTAGTLFLLNYGVLIDNRPDLDIMFVDLRHIWHCVVMTGDPARLRGHWSTNAPVIGIADHRNGFRLESADFDRRLLERTTARQQGGTAIAVCRRRQAQDMERLQKQWANRNRSGSGNEKRFKVLDLDQLFGLDAHMSN